ncbi:DNA polymerase [Nocardioides sp. CER19]|uniref:DNA polymerase n=1 Tax=Nocardioides sp. CER19 TaxID=3038538 RepID=UPI00244BD966|nr:DNA polymerase [Nocardioides sp. CER19]MDH2415814.1 DNA polymerase [Nocardioides sp. CER19]
MESLFPGARKKDLDALRFSVLDMFDPKVRDYACEDAVWTLGLDNLPAPLIRSTGRSLIYQIEMQIMFILCDMEDAGHEVDWEAIEKARMLGVPFEEEMKNAARAMLSKMAGEDLSSLNLASTPQMREALYTKIGLTTNRTTAKGELSTDAQALEALSKEHPAVKKVLEVREVHNLTARQGKWLKEYAGMHDNRVHASFNQMVVPSGRFSANDPAIQQLPKDWRWSIFPKVDPWNDDHWAHVRENAILGKHYWDGNFRDFMIAAPTAELTTSRDPTPALRLRTWPSTFHDCLETRPCSVPSGSWTADQDHHRPAPRATPNRLGDLRERWCAQVSRR